MAENEVRDSIPQRSPTSDFLVCATCRTSLDGAAPTDERGQLCPGCGAVVRLTLGVYDFLGDVADLKSAGDGSFDLRQDERDAAILEQRAPDLTFSDLCALAVDLQSEDEPTSRVQLRARSRYAERYTEMNEQVGLHHGQAMIAKLEPYLDASARPPLRGLALEAGGGAGLLLPGFSRTFDRIVFLDCSLVHIVLARKICREQGIDSVEFVRGDVHALPFADATFNFVHENGIIEHAAFPVRMVGEGVRVTAPDGNYVCLSPNRYSLAAEPHFLVPLFGIYPEPLRRVLIRWRRGVTSEAGTDPRSLRQLRRYVAAVDPPDPTVYFLPPRLNFMARTTPVRRVVQALLSLPLVGNAVSAALNGPLLPVMPYHILVTGGRPVGSAPAASRPST